jgi:hypothetical protein
MIATCASSQTGKKEPVATNVLGLKMAQNHQFLKEKIANFQISVIGR